MPDTIKAVRIVCIEIEVGNGSYSTILSPGRKRQISYGAVPVAAIFESRWLTAEWSTLRGGSAAAIFISSPKVRLIRRSPMKSKIRLSAMFSSEVGKRAIDLSE